MIDYGGLVVDADELIIPSLSIKRRIKTLLITREFDD